MGFKSIKWGGFVKKFNCKLKAKVLYCRPKNVLKNVEIIALFPCFSLNYGHRPVLTVFEATKKRSGPFLADKLIGDGR